MYPKSLKCIQELWHVFKKSEVYPKSLKCIQKVWNLFKKSVMLPKSLKSVSKKSEMYAYFISFSTWHPTLKVFDGKCEWSVAEGIDLNSVFQVICRMRALPLPSSFRWTFNNSYEANEVPINKYKSNGTLSKLNYRAESEKDFGIVHCWAANVLGETVKPCIYTLIPAGNFFQHLSAGKNTKFFLASED